MKRARIKPLELEIPEGDPFTNDLLNRKESAEILTNLVASFEGSGVLAIDSEWGSGKTTFLKIWTQHLRNSNFAVIEFNAWETDFSENPFIALSNELEDRIDEYSGDSSLRKRFAEHSKKLVQQIFPLSLKILSQVLTVNFLKVDPNILSEGLTSKSSYQEAKKSMEDFKGVLNEIATKISESRDSKPLVIAIDELDRCRPSLCNRTP